MTEAAAARRQLSAVAATALVVANMIGTGIFATTGLMARDLGGAPWVLGVWAAGGLLALCGAAVYAELGAMMPRAGGEYVYLSRAFHPAFGFLSGWVSLLVGFSAPIAASATVFSVYLSAVSPAIPVRPAAIALVVALTGLHMADVALGARVQIALTAAKVLLLACFAAGGVALGAGDWGHFGATTAATPGPRQLAMALVYASFAYSGWNAAAYVAGQVRDPGTALPRALLAGTGIVMVLYVAMNVAFFYAAPPHALAAAPDAVADVAARALFGDAIGDLMSGLIAVALISSVSAMVMAGPRVTMAMADDGRFFAVFARRGRRGAPWVAVLAQGGVACALVATAAFDALLTYIGFTLSVFTALTVVAAWRLRRRAPAQARPYRAFGWPLSPSLFLLLSAWMAGAVVYARPAAAAAGALTLAAGAGLYRLWQPDAGGSG